MSYLISYSDGVSSVCREVSAMQEIFDIAKELEKNGVTTKIEIAKKIGSIEIWRGKDNKIAEITLKI